jgi:PPOX class probable F420-dependent enzyme
MASDVGTAFPGLGKVGLLTTLRADGTGVGTPVRAVVIEGTAYFTTSVRTHKVRRIQANDHVTISPCTMRGRVTGPPVAGVARRLEGEEADRIKRALYRAPWGRLRLRVVLRVPWDELVAFAVTTLPSNGHGKT